MSIGNLWSVYNQIKKFCLNSRNLNYRKIILGRNQFQVGASCLVILGAKKKFKKSLRRQSFLPQRFFTMLQAVCFVKIYYFSALRNKHHAEDKQMKNNDKTLFSTLRRCCKPCAGAGNLTSRANFMVEVNHRSTILFFAHSSRISSGQMDTCTSPM